MQYHDHNTFVFEIEGDAFGEGVQSGFGRAVGVRPAGGVIGYGADAGGDVGDAGWESAGGGGGGGEEEGGSGEEVGEEGLCEEERPEGVDLEDTGESVLRDRLERVLGSGYEDAFKYVRGES